MQKEKTICLCSIYGLLCQQQLTRHIGASSPDPSGILYSLTKEADIGQYLLAFRFFLVSKIQYDLLFGLKHKRLASVFLLMQVFRNNL